MPVSVDTTINFTKHNNISAGGSPSPLRPTGNLAASCYAPARPSPSSRTLPATHASVRAACSRAPSSQTRERNCGDCHPAVVTPRVTANHHLPPSSPFRRRHQSVCATTTNSDTHDPLWLAQSHAVPSGQEEPRPSVGCSARTIPYKRASGAQALTKCSRDRCERQGGGAHQRHARRRNMRSILAAARRRTWFSARARCSPH